MTQPIHLIAEIYCMLIPEGAEGFEISIQDDGIPCLTYWYKDILEPTVICLPPGNWQIICTTKECTDNIAAKIVEKDGAFFKCYAGKRSHISPLRSLFCLMDERKCDLNKTLLIIKKVS